MSEDEYVRVSHRMPARLRDAARSAAEYGELSDRVRATYKTVAYGEAEGRSSELQLELETVRDRKERLRGEIRELQSELDTVESREARLEERLAEVQRRGERYEGHLESIETQLRGGTHIFPELPAVQRAAQTSNNTPAEVIAELQERNPEIPDHAFVRADKAPKPWRGLGDPGLRSVDGDDTNDSRH